MDLSLREINQVADCIKASFLTESPEGIKELRKEERKHNPVPSFIDLMKMFPKD